MIQMLFKTLMMSPASIMKFSKLILGRLRFSRLILLVILIFQEWLKWCWKTN